MDKLIRMIHKYEYQLNQKQWNHLPKHPRDNNKYIITILYLSFKPRKANIGREKSSIAHATMILFNTRLVMRNLLIVTVLCLAYLFGKHSQTSAMQPAA